jgi:hypothetical protein
MHSARTLSRETPHRKFAKLVANDCSYGAGVRPSPVTDRSQRHVDLVDFGYSLEVRIPREPGPALVLWRCREGELNPQGTKYRRILSPLFPKTPDPAGKAH